jgi:hypothetical protein
MPQRQAARRLPQLMNQYARTKLRRMPSSDDPARVANCRRRRLHTEIVRQKYYPADAVWLMNGTTGGAERFLRVVWRECGSRHWSFQSRRGAM